MSRVRDSVTGEYSGTGYAVFVTSGRVTRTAYTAGNNPSDSQAVSGSGLGLRTLRRFCVRTCREIAAELGAACGGVARANDKEEA